MNEAPVKTAATNDLVIWGVGPFARTMHYYFANSSKYHVAAFTVDDEYLTDAEFLGLPVIPIREVERQFPPACATMFVAIGYRRMRNRKVLFDRAKSMGYSLANFLASSVILRPETHMGENNVAMDGVVFEPFVSIGDNNVFWTSTIICHDAEVGSHCYAAAKCVLGGASTIGDGCFLGNGSVLIDHVRLAPETHVAPGAVVLRDTVENHKYVGNPAREIGSHDATGIVIERG